jgi:hypothetical protein
VLELLTIHVHQLRHLLTGVVHDRNEDRGAMNTLEMVVLTLGIVAIAAIALAVLREAVTNRVNQLR